MHTLYHQWLNPFCRKIRLALSEKKVEFDLCIENTLERRKGFLKLNPIGDIPVLTIENGAALSSSDAISEYLDEVFPQPSLFGQTPLAKAETRRLVYWFDKKLNEEVTKVLVDEKVIKRSLDDKEPDSEAIRTCHSNIHTHLDYIGYLVDRRTWLSGDELSMADLAAAAHISIIDYLGDVPWKKHEIAKHWYARIKSRPSFRAILQDCVPNLTPSSHYKNLDF